MVTSPYQVCNKSITSWRRQKSVVSVLSCCFPNSIITTCCQLVADLLATSSHVKIVCSVTNKSATSWQLLRLCGSYGETCRMDFAHNWQNADAFIYTAAVTNIWFNFFISLKSVFLWIHSCYVIWTEMTELFINIRLCLWPTLCSIRSVLRKPSQQLWSASTFSRAME